jgi:hypothetical protein
MRLAAGCAAGPAAMRRPGDGPGERVAVMGFGDVGAGLLGCPACDHHRVPVGSITVQLHVH